MKQITNQIQVVTKRSLLERIVKPEIEFDKIQVNRSVGYNVNRAD
jgi:hypothetical protein